ncbi:MAG TPA: hypothetical protein VIY47_09020 [Ignavibacteriaceae bacterium]
MSNRIDKLFKDSLSEHNVSPSAEAWEKVQSGLLKKNNTIITWRLAAVLVLFGALVSLLYYLNYDEQIVPVQLTQTNELVVPEKEKDIDLKSKESNPESTKPTVAQTKSKEVIRKNVNEHSDVKEDAKNSPSENLAMHEKEIKKDVLDTPTVNEPVLIAQTTKPEKPIVIEFTLESLSETPIAEVALNSEDEDSGLRKILYAARDMKNGESDLGIIRDTKNQLFALDFKKDKTKRN